MGRYALPVSDPCPSLARPARSLVFWLTLLPPPPPPTPHHTHTIRSATIPRDTQLSMNDRMKLWLYGRTHDISPSQRMVSGGLSGAAAQAAIYPLEIVRTRLAVSPVGTYTGITHCLAKVYRAEGIRAWYRGMGTAMVGIVPYAGIDIACFEMLKAAAAEKHGAHPPAHILLLSGMTSSCFAQVVAYPLALVRTRLQTQGLDGAPDRYRGMVDAFRVILREEGPRGLYRGLLPNFIKLAPAAALSWLTFEKVKEAMSVEEADAFS